MKKVIIILIIIFIMDLSLNFYVYKNYYNESEQNTFFNKIDVEELTSIYNNYEKILSKYSKTKKNYKIDNAKKLSEIKFKPYSLSELQEYFGTYSQQEILSYNIDNKPKSLDEVDNKFKIEIIREFYRSLYTIYKVKEGGYIYVFYYISSDNNLYVDNSIYINSLKEFNDFNSLRKNKSTYQDVLNISNATEIIFNLPNGIYSYSLLNNGKMLEIKYKDNVTFNKREDLIVESIKEVIIDTPTNLSSINEKDLI